MYLLTESVRLTVSAVSKDHWKIHYNLSLHIELGLALDTCVTSISLP